MEDYSKNKQSFKNQKDKNPNEKRSVIKNGLDNMQDEEKEETRIGS